MQVLNAMLDTRVLQSVWVEIDMRHMKEAPSILLRYTFEKGQHVSKGVLSKFKLGLIFIDLTFTPSSPVPR